MMKLSTMQVVGSTIREDGSCPTAEQILELWGYDEGTVQTVRLSSNFVFFFRDQGVPRFLRFVSIADRSAEEIQAELAWLTQLASEGLQVVNPIASRHGRLLETVHTDAGTFHAVVLTALRGEHVELEDLTDVQYRAWGKALGRLHASSSRLHTDRFSRPSYMDHLAKIRGVIADDPVLMQEYEDLASWLQTLPQTKDTFGLIHFDFELDNLCWDDGVIHMLDFDDCAYHWYAADIAYALRDLFESGFNAEDAGFQAFLDGYREEFAIDDELVMQLPMFLRLRDLLGYAERVGCLDLSAEDTHGWLNPLRGRLAQTAEAYKLSLR